MNVKVKNIILQALVWTMLIAFLSVSMSFVIKKKQAVLCSEIEININEAQEFIDETEVKNILSSGNYYVQGFVCDSINLDKIEKVLSKHNQVKAVETYVTVDGRLVINIEQRKPVLRVFNSKGESFYVDEDGKIMRTSAKYTPRIPVATGNILAGSENIKSCIPGVSDTCDYKLAQLYNLYLLAGKINSDAFMSALIDQIYINDNMLLELVPKISGWIIVIGDMEDIDEKFGKLKLFLHSIPYPDGWDKYKVINLSFKNQIVCTKKSEI